MSTIEHDILIDDHLLAGDQLSDGDQPPATTLPPTSRRPFSGSRRFITVVGEVALTLGALLGVAIAAVTVFAAYSGIQPLVVRSGSMEPAIATGSMVLMEKIDAAEIEVGDIVAVERDDRTRVTHRVVSITAKGDAVEMVLKGDANEDVDPVPVTVRHAQRLVWEAPAVGRALAWLATAPGGFAMGCLVTAVVAGTFGRRPSRRQRSAVRALSGDGIAHRD